MFQPDEWLYLLGGIVLGLSVSWGVRRAVRKPSGCQRPIGGKSGSDELSDSRPGGSELGYRDGIAAHTGISKAEPPTCDVLDSSLRNLERQSSSNKLARLQAIREGRTAAGPRGEDLYMIASECIVFRGTADQCADFLSERGIVPFASAVEPLDLRIEDNLSVLGVGIVDYWAAERELGERLRAHRSQTRFAQPK